MTETQINYPSSNEHEAAAAQQPDPFEDILIMQREQQDDFQRQSAQRAQQLVSESSPTAEATPKPWGPAKKAAATITAGAALVTGGLVLADNTLPKEEIATVTTTVDQGGDITTAVDEALGEIQSQYHIDPADPTERQDVISQAVDLNTDANGIVQPGETVTVTASKTPIFGDTRYDAVPDPAPAPVEAPASENTTIPSPVQKTDVQLPTLPSQDQQ